MRILLVVSISSVRESGKVESQDIAGLHFGLKLQLLCHVLLVASF